MNGSPQRAPWWRNRLAVIILLAAWSPAAFARDVFVMLSGGDSPFDNNYSQYLQARAVTAYFEKHYPPDSVWVFFGAGNVEGEKPLLADVCRQVQRDGAAFQSWLPGSLPHNLPARRSIILNTLRDEILPAIAEGGTLFLFVGDHGSRTHGRNPESNITLWSLGHDPESEHGWRADNNESLSVSELRRVFSSGIGKGRVVFCMTQCHAGGFHYLSIPHEMTPNPKWFTELPNWALPGKPTTALNIAGFAATDEFSMASGCDPDPNPDHWAGYERFIPENLLDLDLFTLKPKEKGLRSFAEAHVAATLADSTIDKPCSTSEQFLERWADLIDTRLAKEPNLTAKVRSAVTAYERIANGSAPRMSDPAFRERQAQFRRFTEKLSGLDSGFAQLLASGSRKQLEELVSPAGKTGLTPPFRGTNLPGTSPRRNRAGGPFGERRRLWRETVRPAWKIAVDANDLTNLTPAVLQFEKHLLSLEEGGSNFFFGRGAQQLEEEVFWESGFGHPQTLDVARADALARWGINRRTNILSWARASSNAEVRTAAEKLSVMPAFRENIPAASSRSHGAMEFASMQTAAERTLFYRRVLAAWDFLLAVNERPALDRVRELTELERTLLPPWKH